MEARRSNTWTVIVDWDGTVTVQTKEKAAFREIYFQRLAALLGILFERAMDLGAEIEAMVLANPGQFGWKYGNRIVAPATADHRILTRTIAEEMLRLHEVPEDERDGKLNDLYGATSRDGKGRVPVEFRPEARYALLQMHALGHNVHIVSNSGTTDIRDKVVALGGDESGGWLSWLLQESRVVGGAQKNVIVDGFERVVSSMELEGLPRTVFPRRGVYANTVAGICESHHTPPGRLLVLGDSLELDGLVHILPEEDEDGPWFALATTPDTLAHERRYVEAHPRGFVVDDLMAVVDFLRAA